MMTTTANSNPSGHPIFDKYTRGWLSRNTGFSRTYISRISTGKLPLTRSFVYRVCYRLKLLESELFLPDQGGDVNPNSPTPALAQSKITEGEIKG